MNKENNENILKDKIITELQSENHTLKTIISMMPGHIYWKDINGKYLGCNNNVARVLKIDSPHDVIGKTDAELVGLPYANDIRKADLEVIENKKEVRIEEQGFDINERPAHYLTQKTPLIDRNGNVIGIFGISLDISLRKQIEEKLRTAKKKAESANRAKSKFLAMISHELRTPLTSLLGFVNLLNNDNIDTINQKKYMQYISDSGLYLLSLINNLLDYNKLETNNYELNIHSFNLKNLISNIINMLSGNIQLKKNLTLSLEYDNKAPALIMSDSHIIQQILINLIGNALKFTDKGRIVVKVRSIDNSHNSALLHISVEDTGIGIPSNELNHIFKRFYQASDVYTRNNSLSGTGLGLAIVKKLVKLLGSQIEVTSVIDQGSTFHFTNRFTIASTEEPSQNITMAKSISIPSLSENLTFHQNKYHVLLIEDDALIQIVHKQMLEDLGYQVDIAQCASETLTMIKKDYNAIFVDIGLPDMSGFDLIKILKQNPDINQHTPIIALTGYSEENERKQCLLAGADKVVIKPISKYALGKLLNEVIHENRPLISA